MSGCLSEVRDTQIEDVFYDSLDDVFLVGFGVLIVCFTFSSHLSDVTRILATTRLSCIYPCFLYMILKEFADEDGTFVFTTYATNMKAPIPRDVDN